ncbi:9531_t:CDS:2 [Cetraspora pellucida]|uniref:9531_t:CDS:1 n=1 Tax=Cetraspora pellucida TaxID=1433469 RepID=A0A9N9EPE7_9GLOM|nr:9531_t:CDS:2 [Cetraspora pellucida]
MLDEKANKSNKFCVCQECVIGSSYEDAYNNRFANTQELVHHHLKNCVYFKQKYSESEQAEILAKSDKVVSTTNNSFQESIDDNSATESEVSSGKILVENILNECTKWPDVQHRTENMLDDLKKRNKTTRIEEENNNNLKGFPRREWIVYYYKSWFSKPPCSILRELQHYESEEYPFDKEIFDQYGGNVLNYWSFCKEIAVELHLVALLKTYKQNIAIPFEQISPDNDNEEEFILSDENTDNNNIDTGDTRDNNHIETVNLSLDESESLTDLYEEEDEVMHQDFLIHSADNLEAK